MSKRFAGPRGQTGVFFIFGRSLNADWRNRNTSAGPCMLTGVRVSAVRS